VIHSTGNIEMNILGISAHYHDSAAALVVDGVPVCAIQEERLSRHKGDAAFPLLAIESCLQHAGIEPDDLDAVVFYERPMLKFDRILTCALRAFPRSWRAFPKAMKNSLGEKVWMRGIISSHLGAVYRAPSVSCCSRVSHRANVPRRNYDGRRGGRVDHTFSRRGRARAKRSDNNQALS
jgi:predicted NodU family carbamoyl transferase